MKKFCELIGKYFGVVIILFFIGGMTCPPSRAFNLDPALTVGVVLVGACRGSTRRHLQQLT